MVRVDPTALESFTRTVYEHLDVPEYVANSMAESLVAADVRGHHSHGTRLTPMYAEYVDEGQIDSEASPTVVKETPTTAIIDGNSLFGQVVARDAVDFGVRKASGHGIATVGIRRSTHLGRIGEWAERTAEEGFAFISFVCNPTSRYVAPAGSTDGRLSTNPVTVGLPSFGATEFPLVLDMATSQVAFGKVKHRMNTGTPLPDGWTTEFPGHPDPEKFHDGGTLLPLGGTVSGYKGTGLAVMGELLAANLSDGHVAGQPEAPWGNQAMFHFVDLERFTTRDAIRTRIEALREHMASAEPSSDLSIGEAARGDEFVFPGRREYETMQAYTTDGIPIADDDAQMLLDLADDLSVPDDVTTPLRR